MTNNKTVKSITCLIDNFTINDSNGNINLDTKNKLFRQNIFSNLFE